jgi:hypothetical protein
MRHAKALLLLASTGIVAAATVACGSGGPAGGTSGKALAKPSGVTSPTDGDAGANAKTYPDGNAGSGSCCALGGAYFDCPDEASLSRCRPPTGARAAACTPRSIPCGNDADAGGLTSRETTDESGDGLTSPPTTKAVGESCTEDSDCDSNVCVVVGRSATGTCSQPCSFVDTCPGGDSVWADCADHGSNGMVCIPRT